MKPCEGSVNWGRGQAKWRRQRAVSSLRIYPDTEEKSLTFLSEIHENKEWAMTPRSSGVSNNAVLLEGNCEVQRPMHVQRGGNKCNEDYSKLLVVMALPTA